ncbi:helix-turn-helix domain-containing protein [Arthrobacter sp. MDT1-48-3]
MTKKPADMSLVELREQTSKGQQGMAAARLALRVRATLLNALGASGLSQKELSERLEVGESRVSQILHGDGNVQISTLAKVLRALGYTIEFKVNPVDSSVPPLPERRSRRQPAGEKKLTDTVTVLRGGLQGFQLHSIDFTVTPEDNEAFYVVTTRDHTTSLRSAGWDTKLANLREPAEGVTTREVKVSVDS